MSYIKKRRVPNSRGLANYLHNLIVRERIIVGKPKARFITKIFAKLISFAKKDDLESKRRCLSYLPPIRERVINFSKKKRVMKVNAFDKLKELGKRYAERNGGYTRTIRCSRNRLGDNAPRFVLALT